MAFIVKVSIMAKLVSFLVLKAFLCVTMSESSIIENLLEMFGGLNMEFRDDLTPEAKLDAMGLIRYYAYPAESHTVVTSDGYILEMHRIMGGRHNFSRVDRAPVLVVHGLLGSSGVWLLNGASNSLGFVLADEGYDVWLANLRGNRYSRRHVTISPESNQFWDFCIDDHALLDLPAMIDHVLKHTKREKLAYIGHSMGSLISLLLLSEKVEYNDKLKPVIQLAPVVYTAFMKSALQLLFVHGKVLQPLNNAIFGTNEFLRFTDFSQDLINFLCTNEIGYAACHSLASIVHGYNQELFPDNLNAVFVHSLSGTSWHVVRQYGQFKEEQVLRKYHRGRNEKFVRFGQAESTDYNIMRVTAPIAALYGYMDLTTSVKNMERLASEIQNLVEFEEVSHPYFNHNDFLASKNVKHNLYNRLVEIMKKHA